MGDRRTAAAGAGGGGHHRRGQVAGGGHPGDGFPLPVEHGADGVGQPGADRRVLFHPGGAGRVDGPVTARGAKPGAGRCADLDCNQRAGLQGRVAAAEMDPCEIAAGPQAGSA